MEPCPRRHLPALDALTSGVPPMSPDSSGELSPFDLSGDIGDICPGSPTDDGLEGNQQDGAAGQRWDSHTEIAEQAKHEAEIENRIAELRKEGFWTPRRLSKFPEPARPKVHWDYLCEEMQWLSADFGQERRWKRGVARKVVRMVVRHHEELKQKEERARREEQAKLRRIATFIAKEVRQFWSNVEKVVQFKQQSRLEEKRKKALDLQLDFIVGQTEKYSDLLSQSLSETLPVSKTSSSCVGSSQGGSLRTSPTPSICQKAEDGDGDFLPLEVEAEEDDEETIEMEEQQEGNDAEAHRLELELLKQESELPLDELLQNLPPEILQDGSPVQGLVSSDEDSEEEAEQGEEDEEFTANEDDAEDEEDTIAAEEEMAGKQDHAEELSQLAREGEMSLEELLLKYSVLPSDQESTSLSERDSVGNEDYDSSDCPPSSDCESEGVEFLVKQDEDHPGGDHLTHDPPEPKKEITDIAATAESLQPKGYTLATTQVKTAVPFLLRGELREYQHIGLEWLVTMYEKKLNGILADEMGLGKTIQTISLLAHLACERGNWGPHLIIVPTSVILNWEMELKRWCPSFKILTYYGSQKERKLKRQGWTKANAFHVCITSYKLVLQDHQAFRRKNWKYLILDEAQNIKNFKSQRWQSLLNFNSQRRLLLTGTPLQNSLMELWSLMHFLMPHVFQSHREFKEWFSNPLTGMIEGSQEYNEGLVRRLHKVLRPFLLRRIKLDVEKQMPKKYEHVIYCRLSKRQRFLYDDFMSQAATRETLASGHFMSVINILMQLRKVCNHPNLFDPRPIHSPFITSGICYTVPSLVLHALQRHPLEHMDMSLFDFINMEGRVSRYERDVFLPQYKQSRSLIQEIAESPEPPPRPRTLKMKVNRMLQPVKPDPRSVVVMNHSRLVQRSPDVATAAAPQPAAPLSLASSVCTPPVPALKAPLPVQSSPAITSVTPVSIVKPLPVQTAQPVCAAPQRLVLTPEMQARLPSGEVISLAQLASLQGRPIQSQSVTKPLTLQLQGAKLTLSGAPMRPLGVGQPRPLQGNVLHLVSSGGQHHLLSQPTQLALIQALAQQAASPAPSVPHLVQNTSQAQIGVQAMSVQSLQHTLVNSASLPAASPGQAPSPGVVKIVVRQSTRDVPASPLHHPVASPMRPLLRVVAGPPAEQSTPREGPGEQRAAPVSTSTLTLATSPLLMMSNPSLSTRLPSSSAQPNPEESSVPPVSGVALRLLTTSAAVQLTNHHSSPPRYTQSPSLPNCCPAPIQNPNFSNCTSTNAVCPDAATPCPSRGGSLDPQSVQNGNCTAVQVSQPVAAPTNAADGALYVNLIPNPPSPPSSTISKMTPATPTYNLSLVPALLANSSPSTVSSSYPIPARFLTSPVSLLALSPLASSTSGATPVLYTAPGATAFPAASVSASLPLLAAPVSFTAPLPVSSSTQSSLSASLSVETPSQLPLTVVSSPSPVMPLSAAGNLPTTTGSSFSLVSAPPSAATPLPLISAPAAIPPMSTLPPTTASLPLQSVPPLASAHFPLVSAPPLATAPLQCALPPASTPMQTAWPLVTTPLTLHSAPPPSSAPLQSASLLAATPLSLQSAPALTTTLPMSAPHASPLSLSVPPPGAATPHPLLSAPPPCAAAPHPLLSAPPPCAAAPLPLLSAPPPGAPAPLPLLSALPPGAAAPRPLPSALPPGAAAPLPLPRAAPPASVLDTAGSQPLVLSSDSASVPLREAFSSDSLSPLVLGTSLKLSSVASSSVPLMSASGTVPLLAAASAKVPIPMVTATSAPSPAGLQPSRLLSAPQGVPLPLLAGAGPTCVPAEPLSSHSILIPAPLAVASMRPSGSCPPSSTPVPAMMTKMVPAEVQTPLPAEALPALPPAPTDAQVTLFPAVEAAGVSSVQPVISGFSQSALPCLSLRIPAPQPSLPVSTQSPSMPASAPAPMPSMPASTPIPLPLLPASTPAPMSLPASSLDPASLLMVPTPTPKLSSSVSACAQPGDPPSTSLLPPPPPVPHPMVISFSAPLTLAAPSPSVSAHSHLPVLAASVLPPQSPLAALQPKPVPTSPGPVTAAESVCSSTTATPSTQATPPSGSLLPSNVQEPSLSLSVADPPTVSVTLGSAAESDGAVEDDHRPLHSAMASACARPRRQLPPPPRSPFYLEPLEERRRKQKLERLDRIFHLNERRSGLAPVYGTEVLQACAIHFSSQQTDTLHRCTFTAEQRLEQLAPIIERFIFAMPPVEAPQITLHTSHPPPSLVLQESIFKDTLSQGLTPHTRCLHGIISNMRTQFPDLRLIQYDCGKLQTMDRLLRQLKSGGHRVLIFTQMTRMLDVLEQFLNYHGHIYLRLDGSTRVEQRQVLMERFNMDKRIFCFILSTRSGGVGVNLTGADTVIFYDSDWNPTMDAQAQDRCHRIGQTRDVHIYRLVSERTVEENILKKAQQKRLLGDMAIEGGNFTTAYFKQHTIRELFDMEDTPRKEVEARNTSPPDLSVEEGATSRQEHILEQALCGAEDEEDTLAASLVRAEQVADLAEFNENVPLEPEEEEQSRAEQEISALVEQLTPIERYAMYYLEASLEEVSKEELKQAEEQVEAARKDLFLAKDEVGLMTEEKWDEENRRNRKIKTPLPNKPPERVGVRMSERLRGSKPTDSLDHTENLTIPDTVPQSQEEEAVHGSPSPTRSNQATPEPKAASPSAETMATQVLTMDTLPTPLLPTGLCEEDTVPEHNKENAEVVMENVTDTGSVPGSPDSPLPGTPDSPLPGTPDSPLPGTPKSALPGSPESTAPGSPESAAPGSPESVVPGSPIPPRTPRRKVYADSEITLAGATEDSPTAKVLRRLPGRLVTVVQEWLPTPRRQNRGRGCQTITGNDGQNSSDMGPHSPRIDLLSEETSETGSPPPKRKRGRPPKTRGDMSPTCVPIDMPLVDSLHHTALDLGTAPERPMVDLVTPSVLVQTPGSPNSSHKVSSEIESGLPIEKRKRGRPPKRRATPMSPQKLDTTPCVASLASSKLCEVPSFASLLSPKKYEDLGGELVLTSPVSSHRDSTPELHDRDTAQVTCSSVSACGKSDGQNEFFSSGLTLDSIIPSVSSNIPTVTAEGTSSSGVEEPMSPPKRKRGRPRKIRPLLQNSSSPMLPITDSSPERSPSPQVTRTSLQRKCKPLMAEALGPREQNSYLADTDNSSDEEVTVSTPLTRSARTRLQSTSQTPPVVFQNSTVSSKSSRVHSPHTVPVQEKPPTKKRKPQSVSSPSPSSSSPHGSSSESRKRPCPPAERVLRSSLTANPASNTRSSRSPLLNSPSSHRGRKAKT